MKEFDSLRDWTYLEISLLCNLFVRRLILCASMSCSSIEASDYLFIRVYTGNRKCLNDQIITKILEKEFFILSQKLIKIRKFEL